MPGQCKCGGCEALYRVAILTSTVVRLPRELRPVNVLVTIRAARRLDFVLSLLAQCEMTFGARDRGMLAFKGVVGGRMFGDSEFRLLESIDRMAGLTRAAILARAKLALMMVLVTIRTLVVRQRSIEVQTVMARGAAYAGMVSLKGVTGFPMVETGSELRGLNLLPCGRRMT